ncbi:MAG: hypothetical protein A3I61_00340 [Acidobacteria bacterium RIFCSPLOWO2_02_FULL_68_18]|nr:MAG: hypothetical protein A3I61_00340 [Acidobacteria bacterium RIFCSPLOWO2_02_FULL_68_18]OFW49476.1 MAG: hypothetical protein A3G77_02385 [Acidobacteria bacterium RIFCSPLOWO2_12_FULL_68_19]
MFTGPSEFALSVTMTATPDRLPRDGSSQSVITVTVRDVSSRPVPAQRLRISSNVGTVSESEVVSDNEGRATFAFTAPPATTISTVATAVISVVPIDPNAGNAAARTVSIQLTGTSNTAAPLARFSSKPDAPALKETVTFDASDTLDEYTDQTPFTETDDDPKFRCHDACTYAWDFGGEATGTGRIVTYQFQTVRTYTVTLRVTDSAASVGSKTKNVTVAAGTVPTASISFSPSSPAIYETVNFTGEASTAGQAGRTIVNHQWQFGDGTSGTGLRVTKTYSRTGTYTVVLTVTDSAGLQGTKTQDVTVVAGVTADFTISPTGAAINQTIVLNAESSQGSNGFGGRNPISKYIWNFGNSTSTTEESDPITSTSYSVAGTYTIVLTVEDSAGRRATKSRTVTVE